MSFRSEAANVRSKLASGSFKKANPDPYGFKGFAEQVTFGIRADAEKRRQEELIEKKEEFARKRAAAAKQAAKDEKDKKNSSLANLYLSANKMDVTPQNREFVLNIITSGSVDNLTDLNSMMSQYTTYNPGATTELPTNSADQAPPFRLDNQDGSTDTTLSVDDQTQDMLDLNPQQRGDNPTETVQESGTLSFSGSKGKDVLTMDLAEVRFELSSDNLSEERKALLNRRLESLTDPAKYDPTTLYHTDGREVTARTADEEAQYKEQGFTLVKGSDPSEYTKRTLYKDGGSVEVFSAEEEKAYKDQGYSAEKPAATEPFVKRTLFKDGQKLVITTQAELDTAQMDGWTGIEPASATSYKERTLYKDGAEVKVYSEEEYNSYVSDGWDAVKPKKDTEFKQRTLFDSTGQQTEVFTQADMDRFTEAGFTTVKPAAVEKFQSRTLYNGDQEVKVFTAEEHIKYLKEGWSNIKTAAEKFTPRTLYQGGNEIVVNSLEEYESATEKGFGPVKTGDIEQIMKDLNVSRETATRIDQGLLKITTNKVGTPVVVDITDPASATPIELPENYQEAMALVRSTTAENIGAAPEDINGDTMDEDGNVIMSSEEKKALMEAQKELGFQTTIEALNNPNSAFGVGGWGTNILNKAAGLGNAQFDKDSAEAEAILSNLRLITTLNITTAFPGLRDSVALRDSILEIIPPTKKFWVSATEAKLGYNAIRDALLFARNVQRSKKVAKNNLTSTEYSKAVVADLTLTPLIDVYTTLIDSMTGMETVSDDSTLNVQEIPQNFSKQPSVNTSSDIKAAISGFEDSAAKRNLTITPDVMASALRSIGYSEDEIKSELGEDYVAPSQENK